ncbi:type IV pilus biogenesis protein PilM [Effusibacillus consociatus]|uniref:Type IV pilus biogenesis protein PilM n=1 Tax=Effusibacillus consociatus TaxID=1117041 RepID=A0ABV9Q3Z6_9BACL
MQFTLQRHFGIGISLDEDRVEVVRVRDSLGIVDVMAHAAIPFSKNVYDNGRIRDVQRFASELSALFDTYDLPKKGITVSLPSSMVALRMLSMPKVNRKQMEQMLQFQIQNEIRLPFADPVYDFDSYPSSFHSEDTILLVATPRDLVNGLVEAFREAGLRLAAIEAKGFSILRAVKALDKLPETETIVAEFGVHRIDAHFYKKGCLLMTRPLDIRADDYVQQPDYPDSFSRDLSYQIQRSISFVQYSLKQRDTAIDTIFLTGHVPDGERLAECLATQLDIAVKILDKPADRQLNQPLNVISLSATGAALRGVKSDAD